MRIRMELPFQTFNDGICRICSVENAGGPGGMPVERLEERASRVPYERRTVGIKRFYDAKRAGTEVDMLIRIPARFQVSTMDVCILDKARYGIQQVQEVRDVMPEAKDLTLRRMGKDHGIAGV